MRFDLRPPHPTLFQRCCWQSGWSLCFPHSHLGLFTCCPAQPSFIHSSIYHEEAFINHPHGLRTELELNTYLLI